MSKNLSLGVSVEVPRDVPRLIGRLWQADKAPAVEPLLDAQTLAQARQWAVRVLLDTPSLLEHIRLLEQCYEAPFPFLPPRRDRWEEPSASGSPALSPEVLAWWQRTHAAAPSSQDSAPTFSPRHPLTPERAFVVVEKGPEQLTPREVVSLLLSPFVLCDLSERISIGLTEFWLPRMDKLGRELMRSDGLEVPPRHTDPNPDDTSVSLASEETFSEIPKPPHDQEKRPGKA